MRYYKLVKNGYLISVGTGIGGEQITESEYTELLAIIRSAPTAPDGYTYKLRADALEWELVELPPFVEEYDEQTALTRYANELTGANDSTLTEAAETMILKLAKED